MQKDWRLGKEVIAPVAKAHISVTEVIVMEAPACFIARPIFVTRELFFFSSWDMLSKQRTITNMSSMPIPRLIKGRIPFEGYHVIPRAAAIEIENAIPRNTDNIPVAAK